MCLCVLERTYALTAGNIDRAANNNNKERQKSPVSREGEGRAGKGIASPILTVNRQHGSIIAGRASTTVVHGDREQVYVARSLSLSRSRVMREDPSVFVYVTTSSSISSSSSS